MKSKINEVKQFWDNSPCNINHSKKEIGTKEYFEEVEKKKFYVEPHIIKFSSFPSWKNKKVLEIGCGLGSMGINFARNGAKYTGVELSDDTCALAKQNFEVNNLEGDFYIGNAEELSKIIKPEPFDLIYSFGVIHHTPNPEKIISELNKFMKSGSILKIMLYANNSWKNILINAGLDQPERQYGCPIANTYTVEEVKQLLRYFSIKSIQQDHIFPYQIAPYKKGQYIKQPWFDSMPKKMFKELEKYLGWHLLITAEFK